MKAETYNGWTNYETWLVNLWLTNEEPVYHFWYDHAKRLCQSLPLEDAQIRLSDDLRQFHRDNVPLEASVWLDLVNAALSEVDWLMIAKSFTEGMEETTEIKHEQDNNRAPSQPASQSGIGDGHTDPLPTDRGLRQGAETER